VDFSKVKEIISKAKVSPLDPLFFQRIFTQIARDQKLLFQEDHLRRLCKEEYDDLSRRLDLTKIQESCSVRNVLRSRAMANDLIDDQGHLDMEVLSKLIPLLSEYLYSLGPNRQHDSVRQEHFLKVLKLLKADKELQILLKTISKPYSHPMAEQFIRDTLGLSPTITVTDVHARRAVLSAWLCYLRQNVGSCFATAPAIIIHDEQPAQFLKDMNEMLGTGRLLRTFGGVEYSVPISVSSGAGDLKKNVLIPFVDGLPAVEIWYSPGLIAAFEATGFMEGVHSLKERIEKSKQLILSILKLDEPYQIISAEEIINQVLLKAQGLTENDIEDYRKRSHGVLKDRSLIQVSAVRSVKGEACSKFLELLVKAQRAFKCLADNELLKVWEFTLASFAETKTGFTRWNLYSSLGLRHDEPGGIGNCVYSIIKQKLDESNEKMSSFQAEYESLYAQVKALEGRLKGASSEREAQWLKVEYQSRANEFYLFEEMRNKFHARAHRLANMYDQLINFYDNLFPQYFQEVYDADMHEVKTGPYDDSPAGFRLLYKHGRSNTSQWTLIRSPEEYVEALVSFFIQIENELRHASDFQEMDRDLTEISTAIIAHVRSNEFLETSFYRIAKAHQTRPIEKPLEHLDQIDKKPWAYTSGGTMDNLVSCYYKREQKPTIASRWVESPMELLVFFVDVMKQVPHKLMEEFQKNPKKSMLIHSPTHAFLIKPGMHPFVKAWQTEAFTYTWLRDNCVKPRERFVEELELDKEMMDFLISQLVARFPDNYKEEFQKVFQIGYSRMNSVEFRHFLIGQMQSEQALSRQGRLAISSEEIDSLLYNLLPLFSKSQLRERVRNIFEELSEITPDMRRELENGLDLLLDSSEGVKLFTAKSLQEICKVLLCLITGQTHFRYDYHQQIAQAAQKLGYAMPEPIIFADSNWVKDLFGFVINPGNGKLELWRMDVIGGEGVPMADWKQWLNGSKQEPQWGIYTRPYEYGQ
jgi:hypothetical protein